MALILDTNAISAFVEGDADLLRVIEAETDLSIPVIVIGEYLFGIQQSRFRTRYERWLDANLPLFDLLNISVATARHYAVIRHELKRAGNPIPSNDIWIAALAREHRMTVVSRDRHFEAVSDVSMLVW